MAALLYFLDVLLLAFFVLVLKKLFSKRGVSLPPGPRKLPLIENLLDMPNGQEWLTFADWGAKWGMFNSLTRILITNVASGDIVSVSVFGQTMIIINSAQTAFDMLDKKSSIYSERPVLQMGGELVGWKNTLVLLPYGERFRNFRKLFHQTIGTPRAMENFHPIEEKETREFLKRVLARPEDLAEHIRR